jgi:hypothetical protein
MHIDHARELKARLTLELGSRVRADLPTIARSPHGLAIARAYARAETDPPDPLLALGIARAGRTGTKLAVRVQHRFLHESPVIDLIRRRAKDEVDIRYIGRVYSLARPARPAVKPLRRRDALAWHRTRQRPLVIGSSIGFASDGRFQSAGTLGCFVRPRAGAAGRVHLLSNNHVLADENRLEAGAAIVQPGGLDGGAEPADVIARLGAYIQLRPGSRINVVDAAIAQLEDNVRFDPVNILGKGSLGRTRDEPLTLKVTVHKAGRTTGVTTGVVTAIELDNVRIGYDIGTVRFDNQIEIEGIDQPFSDAGDSGSLIVDNDLNAAALLFAGSDHGGKAGTGLTYAHPIQSVLDALKIELVTA